MGIQQGVVRHMQDWLYAYLTGCKFATRFARDKVLMLGVLGGPERVDEDELNDFLVRCSRDDYAALVIFPSFRSEREVVTLCRRLAGFSRWTSQAMACPSDPEITWIALQWETPEGMQCQTMGLAPLITMPVTRRAPYVAIAGWPGTRRNTRHRTPGEGNVSLLDMAHGLASDEYDTWFQDSEERTGLLLREPPDDARQYRTVAFCLSRLAYESTR